MSKRPLARQRRPPKVLPSDVRIAVEESTSKRQKVECQLAPAGREVIPKWTSNADLLDDQLTLFWIAACKRNPFLNGEGGTGKTFAFNRLIRDYMSGKAHFPQRLIVDCLAVYKLLGPKLVRLVTEYAYSAVEMRRTVIITAPTGTAASHYAPHGCTVDSLLGMTSFAIGNTAQHRLNEQISAHLMDTEAAAIRGLIKQAAESTTGYIHELEELLDTRVGRMISATLIIIDEQSMLHPHKFFQLDKVMRQVRGVDDIMGGCNFVLAGDVRQLPPVITKEMKAERGGDVLALYRWFLKDDRNKDRNGNYYVLFQNWFVNVRQRDDDGWRSILSRLRIGEGCTEEEIDMLMAREDDPKNGRPLLQKAINDCKTERLSPPMRIWARNVDVDAKNAQQLERVPGKLFELRRNFQLTRFVNRGMHSVFLGHRGSNVPPVPLRIIRPRSVGVEIRARDVRALYDACNKLIESNRKSEGGKFKPNTPVCIRANVDVSRGLANGTPAVLLRVVGPTTTAGATHLLSDEKGTIVHDGAIETWQLERRNTSPSGTSCTVHTADAFEDYDQKMIAFLEASAMYRSVTFATTLLSSAGKTIMLPVLAPLVIGYLGNMSPPVEPALVPFVFSLGCECNGMLITTGAGTPERRTTVLPFQTRQELVRLPSTPNTPFHVRMQFPALSLDFARTVHGTQGLTCSHVAIALSTCTSSGQAYTALSRVKKLSGLVFEHQTVTRDMFRKGTMAFKQAFYADPHEVAFCTHKHPLPAFINFHPSRAAWLEFQLWDFTL